MSSFRQPTQKNKFTYFICKASIFFYRNNETWGERFKDRNESWPDPVPFAPNVWSCRAEYLYLWYIWLESVRIRAIIRLSHTCPPMFRAWVCCCSWSVVILWRTKLVKLHNVSNFLHNDASACNDRTKIDQIQRRRLKKIINNVTCHSQRYSV